MILHLRKSLNPLDFQIHPSVQVIDSPELSWKTLGLHAKAKKKGRFAAALL
jgi:hypothetical protein